MCLIGVALVGLAASGMITISYPKIARSYDASKDKTIVQSVIKLSRDSEDALTLIKIKPDIIPGESNVQKQNREEAEALALAKSRKYASANTRNVVSRERRTYVDPTSFDTVYAAAEAAYGVDARLLRAIHYVETGCSGSTTKSNPSGATGPMQFLPSTFARHGVDGNGDGIKDVHNLEDSVFAAAAYLKACGYPNLKSAILGYNRSISYYYKVMKVAGSLGFSG